MNYNKKENFTRHKNRLKWDASQKLCQNNHTFEENLISAEALKYFFFGTHLPYFDFNLSFHSESA